MKKFFLVFALNFMYWATYFVVIFVFLLLLKDASDPKYITEARERDLIRSVVLMFFWPAVLNYLINYIYVIRFLKAKQFLKSGLIFLLFLVIFSCFSSALAYYTSPFQNKFSFDFIGTTILLSIIGLFHGVMGLIIKGFVLWFEEMKQKQVLQEQNHQMELALVKSQLDPHFLFNSINNIDVLIHKDADKASAFLNKLSDIMRFMLFETKNENIALSKELTYIEKYIELQRIRSSNGQYVQFSKQLDNEHQSIAPMLFIPFIENAFKYSEIFKSEEAVIIQLELLNGKLKFICKNRYSVSSANKIESNGLGNDLIQKRIGLLYPDHKLTISKDEIYFSVLLELDL
jgi:two-component system LytT family sensor kinase